MPESDKGFTARCFWCAWGRWVFEDKRSFTDYDTLLSEAEGHLMKGRCPGPVVLLKETSCDFTMVRAVIQRKEEADVCLSR